MINRLGLWAFAASTGAFAFSHTAATAADIRMPVKAPPPAAVAVFNWTGCYLGAGAGYGMFNQKTQLVQVQNGAPFGLYGDLGGRGWFGTIQGGCDHQVGSNIVFGAFADYDFSGIKGNMSTLNSGFYGREKLTSSWAVGGRIGWLPSPQLLTFVSTGYTQARFGAVSYVNLFNAPIDLHLSAHTYSGWFIGAGYEYALGWLPGLFWKTEYRFADYSTDRVPVIVTSTGAPSAFAFDLHKRTHSVRSELVWRWNAGGASVAPVTNAPQPVRSAVTWTGCYVGAGGGYGMFNQETGVREGFPAPTYTNGGDGWFGTVQGGCDYQVSANLLVGAFADYDFSSINGQMMLISGFSLRGEEKLSSAWAAGGRVGWLPFQPFLAYVSAGYAQARFGRVDLVNSNDGAPGGTHVPAHTYNGWFVGGGYEYHLGWLTGLFWKTEYRFADYGNDRVPGLNNGNGAVFAPLDLHKYVQTVRSELIWRFNFGGPVVARY